MRVTVVDADRDGHAVLILLGAPATSERPYSDNEQFAVGRRDAVDIGKDQVRMMASDGAVWYCWASALKTVSMTVIG